MRKLIILLLIISLVFLYGCKANEVNKNAQSLVPVVAENNRIDLANTDKKQAIDFYVSYYIEPPMNKTEKIIWEEFMHNEYGYHFNIEYYKYNNKEQVINEESDGIVLLKDNGELKYFAGKNDIKVLNEVIKANESPDISYQKDLDDNIYSIPFLSNTYRFFRLYDKKMMEENKLAIPTSFEKMIDCSKVLKKNGYYFTMYEDTFSGMTRNLKDILLSFGCYPSFGWTTGIGYNPITNQFEDAILSDSFKNAMINIKYARDNKYILPYISDFGFATDFTDINVASFVNIPDAYGNFPELMDASLALQGNVDENLIYSSTNNMSIGILNKNTEVDRIVEMFTIEINQNEKIKESIMHMIYGYSFSSFAIQSEISENDRELSKIINDANYLDDSLFYNPEEKVSFDMPSVYNSTLVKAANQFYTDYFTEGLSYEISLNNYIANTQIVDKEAFLSNLNQYIIEKEEAK